MHVSLSCRPLLKAVSHAHSVIAARNTLPILSFLRLDAEGDTLTLTATDADLQIILNLPDADVKTAGATLIEARLLHEILRKSPDNPPVELTRKPDTDQITLTIGRSRFQLRTAPADDLPTLEAADTPHTFTLPASELRRLIARTRFIIPQEETRHYINGLHLHPSPADADAPPTLHAAATDGHRLAALSLPLPQGAADLPPTTIPRKTIAELQKLIDNSDEDIQIALSETQIRFAMEATTLSSKLIDGTFPDYQRVIPQDNNRHITLNRPAFRNAIDRVATISAEKSRAVTLRLTSNALAVTATNQEGETAHEDLAASYEGDEMQIGFNATYLLEIFDACEGDDITLSLKDGGSPALIRDSEDDNATYILMPMRI